MMDTDICIDVAIDMYTSKGVLYFLYIGRARSRGGAEKTAARY